DGSFEPSDGPIDLNDFVNKAVVETGEIFVEEPDVSRIARRPAVVLQGPAHEIGGDVDAIRPVFLTLQDLLDLEGQLGCHLLVGIDIENPAVPRETYSKVLLRSVTGPVPVDDPGA